MSKIKCNVIKDLLPSYMDGLCSAESRKLIEEHLSECEDCRNMVENMQETELVDHKLQQKEIDYMKKIRQQTIRKNMVMAILFAGILISAVVICVHSWRSGRIPVCVYATLMFAIISATGLCLDSASTKDTNPKQKKSFGWITVISTALAVYEMLLLLLFPQIYDMEQTGALLAYQLIAIAVVQCIFYVITVVTAVTQKKLYLRAVLPSVYGLVYAFMSIMLLWNLDTVDGYFENAVKNSLVLMAVFIGILVLFLLKTFAKINMKIMYGICLLGTVTGIVGSQMSWSRQIENAQTEYLETGTQIYYMVDDSEAASGELTPANGKDGVTEAQLSLDPVNMTFSLGYDPLSSYLSAGSYQIEGDILTATTSDGLYHYTFEIESEDTLVFLADQSSEITLCDPSFGVLITDGDKFVKFAVEITN